MTKTAAAGAAEQENFATIGEMAKELELTIIMPCLNEAETLATCIDKAQSYLTRSGIKGEVLIADNGSTDGSQEIARRHGARVVDVPSRGYGAALLGGIAAAQGRYIIMGDADDSYDFSQLDNFVAALRAGSDLVMGNRFRGGIEPDAMPPLHKYLGNPLLSFLGRLFFRIPVGDFHCGLRGFRADAIRALRLQTTGMEFASEMVVCSALAKLKITETPTVLRKDGRSRPPHLKTWRDGWRHLKFLLMYSPRWLFIIPGMVLLCFGSALALALLFGPLRAGEDLVLDINTFISAAFLVVLGMQLLTFGALARYYATVTGFLPSTPRADALVRYTNTDRLVWIAGLLILAGAALFVYAVSAWGATGFGRITDPIISRVVVAGMTLVVIGLQVFFSAFFLGVLEIPLRPAVDATRT